MILFLLPLLGTVAWVHVLIDEARDRRPKPKAKPAYTPQPVSSKPYLGPKRPRSAEFYRNRRVKKALRKLPF